jgi:hypothetical protein
LTITAANIQTQDYGFRYTTASGTWRWVTRMDVSGAGVVFEIREINSPFGSLRDTIPIPGEVITAMADSITEVQSNFPPNILLGPPPTPLVFDVDEGRGFSDSQNVVVTNDGVFGSLLNIALATSASYVTTTPATVGNLAANEAGSFDVAVDSTDLLASMSPISETISASDANASNSPIVYDVTINVRPKATIALSSVLLSFTVSKPLTGSFPAIPSQTFEVENTGAAGSSLDYQIRAFTGLAGDWLSGFAPVTELLASGATQLTTVSVAPIDSMGPGFYEEILRVSGYSTNSYVDLTVQLTIT